MQVLLSLRLLALLALCPALLACKKSSSTPAPTPTTPVATGTIVTYAGNGVRGFYGDGGVATSAEFYSPTSLVIDASGNLYIADGGSQRVRLVSAITGIVTTVVGSGTPGFYGDGGAATSAELNQPLAVALDAASNLYVVDYLNQRIRKVNASSGIITTVAGNGTLGFSGDGGPAVNASLSGPSAVVVDAASNLYIADWGNNRIRKVAASTGNITTVAGSGPVGFTDGAFGGDGGPATSALLSGPKGLALDAAGNLLIADVYNHRIRKVDVTTGIITTVVGSGTTGSTNGSFGGDGGPATAALLNQPISVTVDAAGNLYLADRTNRVRLVTASTGIITTVVGNGTIGYQGDGGTPLAAEIALPNGLVVVGTGTLYIADVANYVVRKAVF